MEFDSFGHSYLGTTLKISPQGEGKDGTHHNQLDVVLSPLFRRGGVNEGTWVRERGMKVCARAIISHTTDSSNRH